MPRGGDEYSLAGTDETGYQLAQINIARLRAPLDSPELADFVAALEPINALADGSPGFVWRLQTEDGDATAIRPFDDDDVLRAQLVRVVRRSLDVGRYRRNAHTVAALDRARAPACPIRRRPPVPHAGSSSTSRLTQASGQTCSR